MSHATRMEAVRPVLIPSGNVTLQGELSVPPEAAGIVLFAHGSGSSRHSPRNRYVADVIHDAGLGTLLFDLLTSDEERIDRHTGELRFDIGLLARRLLDATAYLGELEPDLRPGYFGASTGAAAALAAAARRRDIFAVVSRGGRPDLADDGLPEVRAPTLLIVGGEDRVVLEMNRDAASAMAAPCEVAVVPGATHLFEEPGALEEVARLAANWFWSHLAPGRPSMRTMDRHDFA